jgi:hypothetical protein
MSTIWSITFILVTFIVICYIFMELGACLKNKYKKENDLLLFICSRAMIYVLVSSILVSLGLFTKKVWEHVNKETTDYTLEKISLEIGENNTLFLNKGLYDNDNFSIVANKGAEISGCVSTRNEDSYAEF